MAVCSNGDLQDARGRRHRADNDRIGDPHIIPPKKNRSLLFCVNYRQLIALTVRNSYSQPRTDERIDSLHEATIFSTLDANLGYWQIEIDPTEHEKIMFRSHHGVSQFTRFQLVPRYAPATFQRAIDVKLSSVKWKLSPVYLDDPVIFLKIVGDEMSHFRQAVTPLRGSARNFRLEKRSFLAEKH